jgi:thiamine biosynthesis lipoprotein
MGTGWSVQAVAPRAGPPEGMETGIAATLDAVIAQMSNWEADSDISRFNRSPPGQWQMLPDAFATVLRAGLDVARGSDGAFDPAIGGLVDRWGVGPAGYRMPPTAAAPIEGWRAIEMDGARARRTADVTLDFSGIAKGFAVDAVARYLDAAGVRNSLVEIGGELRGTGIRPDGQPWWVDLETPPGLPLPTSRVALCGISVATSGDYRRFVENEGQRYAHSIDPRTGAPVCNGVTSVSVLHDSAMLADAWATALMVLGVESGLRTAAREGLAALMVTRGADGAKEWMSPGFAAMLD